MGTGRWQGKPQAGGERIRPAGTQLYAGQAESAPLSCAGLYSGQGLPPPEADFEPKLIFLTCRGGQFSMQKGVSFGCKSSHQT